MLKKPVLLKFAAAATVAAGLAVVAPGTAFADSGNQYVNVNPGATVCVRDAAVANYSAHAEGTVVTGHPVRFTVAAYTTVYDTNSPVTSFAFDAYPFNAPGSFPGRFQVCATNQSLKPSSVRMRVSDS